VHIILLAHPDSHCKGEEVTHIDLPISSSLQLKQVLAGCTSLVLGLTQSGKTEHAAWYIYAVRFILGLWPTYLCMGNKAQQSKDSIRKHLEAVNQKVQELLRKLGVLAMHPDDPRWRIFQAVAVNHVHVIPLVSECSGAPRPGTNMQRPLYVQSG
jgi:hypothetical protein